MCRHLTECTENKPLYYYFVDHGLWMNNKQTGTVALESRDSVAGFPL